MSCIITNFLLHRTGWFHTSKMRSSTHFSDDPNAEGVVTLKPDGTLAIEKMDLDSKVGQLKTLFFATDKPIPREVRTYFQRFQGYRAEQDESGNFNLIFYHTSVEPELIRIDPVDSSNFPEIMELFAEKNIAADEVLIVDDALIAKTAAIIATQDQKDPEIIRSIKELRTCPDLTQIKCLDLASHMFMSTEEDEIKISQCPSLEFVDLHTSKPLARLSAQAWKNLREIKLSDALQLGNCRSLEVLNIKYLNRAEDQLFPSDFQSNLREVYVYSARPKIQESFLSQIENPDLVSLMSSSEFTPLCLTRSHARVLISGITLGESKDKNSFPNLMYLDISETRSELDTVTLLSQTSFELLKLGLNVLKRACETSALTLKARTLILDLNFLAANLSSLNYKAEKLFLLTSYLSPAKAGVLVFLHHKFGDFSHIHLSARFVNRETHHLLSELQKLSAGKFTFSYVFHELSTPADSVPGARTLNPLAFDPSDSSAWRAQAIFVGLHGPVSPSDYL